MKGKFMHVLSAIFGAAVGAAAVEKVRGNKLNFWRNTSNKHLAMIRLYDQWVASKQEGKSIVDYFINNDIKTIAIYGMSFMGNRLYEELKNTNIEVKYAIDKKADNICADIDVISPKEDFPHVDAIVVTAFYFFDAIEEELCNKTDIPLISLEDIFYEI